MLLHFHYMVMFMLCYYTDEKKTFLSPLYLHNTPRNAAMFTSPNYYNIKMLHKSNQRKGKQLPIIRVFVLLNEVINFITGFGFQDFSSQKIVSNVTVVSEPFHWNVSNCVSDVLCIQHNNHSVQYSKEYNMQKCNLILWSTYITRGRDLRGSGGLSPSNI